MGESNRKRRITYDMLTLASFRATKIEDGRKFARYRDENGAVRFIYRYQWVWEQANGPIPDGMDVHHKNEDCTDDRLENLELKTVSAHRKLHAAAMTAKVPTRTCPTCGESFKVYSRGRINRPDRYCSKLCWYKSEKLKAIGTAVGRSTS